MKKIKLTTALFLSLLFIFLTGCNVSYVSDILTTTDAPESTTALQVAPTPESTTVPQVTPTPETTTVPQVTPTPETTTVPPVTAAPETTTVPPVTASPETSTQAPAVDYSKYTKAQICDTFASAVNKTKRYTAPVNVHHTESFDFEVTECIGGDMVAFCVNNLLALVVKPSDTVYSFNNGTSVNEDGETIPLLLPQKGDCVLPANGVVKAEIKEENGLIHIYLVLVEEHTAMGEVPVYNAGAVGYLNTDEYSFNLLKITEADIGYTGTEIDAYINADGMIDKVTYKVNLDSSGSGTGLGINGSASIVGAQTEKWDIQW